MIQFENVHVGFNLTTPLEVQALRGITLNINEGEFVTVIGSNGAGKSTLLNALTGECHPWQGTLKVDGVDVTEWSPARRSSLVSRVFQDPMIGTYADLTIEENLALALRRGQRRSLTKALNSSLRAEFQKHLATLEMGLEKRLKDPIGLLSGGQRQTLSLLMAVLSPMKILVLDEHTASLDPKMAAVVLELTQNVIKDRGLTALMVTHSMHQALELGTRTVMLHQGKVVFDISGPQRCKLEVADLLALFKRKSGEEMDDDSLVLD